MKYLNTVKFLLVLVLNALFLASTVHAAEELPDPYTYIVHPSEVDKIIRMIDDPQDLVKTYPLKKAIPPEVYKYLEIDIEAAKKMTEEIVQLRSPDLVNKIAPDIKPGKYTYKDLDRLPGLKDLFPPEMLIHIRPGGPPLIGAIPEFEIIPTTQFYWYNRMCEATLRNMGKTKLDKDGYLLPETWESGVPFPRPSEPHKGWKVYYNFEKRFETFERCVTLNGEFSGYDRNFKRDNHGQYAANFIRLKGRVLFPPYGWLDERAKENGEFAAFGNIMYQPRSRRGTVVLQYQYDDPNRLDPWLIYVPSLRRIRKMTSTDTQDPQGDMSYDDRSHITQKITPKRYPCTFNILEEREYLMPISVDYANVMIDSKDGLSLKGMQFMRRPCYTLEQRELDPNYLYSKRILYVDKEYFCTVLSGAYDQKGRLYRSQFYVWTFLSDIGHMVFWGLPSTQFDHVDQHSHFQMQMPLPAAFSRKDFTIQELIKKGK